MTTDRARVATNKMTAKIFLLLLSTGTLAFSEATAQSFQPNETEVQNIISGLKCRPGLECQNDAIGSRTRGLGRNRNFKFELNTEKGRDKILKSAEKGELPSIDREIYFAFDSDELTASSQQMLTNVGTALNRPELRPYRFLLVGHTDAKGSRSYNKSLSKRRARAARQFLVSNLGIAPGRLASQGKGEDNLKLPQSPLAAQNRRVEFINAGPQW